MVSTDDEIEYNPNEENKIHNKGSKKLAMKL